MPKLILRAIQYHPDTGAVALLLEHDFGGTFANTTEAALTARMTGLGENWGNAEALAEAQAWVDADPRLGGKGYVVELPAPPAPPTPPEPATESSPSGSEAPRG
jgi:hypothetical protein